VGAGAAAMTSKRLQMEDASLTTELFLSQVRDLDYAEAVTRLQSATTTMQTNLQTSAVTLNLTLLDYLS
jgi:flagellin-like hook-associated protein FlgL